MLTDKNIIRLEELSKMNIPQNTLDLARKILFLLPGEDWDIYANLNQDPVEVQLYELSSETSIEVSIIQK